MSKIAVVGDMESVYGFDALGVDTYFTRETKSAKQAIEEFCDEGYVVIFVTEKIVSEIHEDINKLNEDTLSAIIPIPGVYGNTGVGKAAIREAVIKAIGSEI